MEPPAPPPKDWRYSPLPRPPVETHASSGAITPFDTDGFSYFLFTFVDVGPVEPSASDSAMRSSKLPPSSGAWVRQSQESDDYAGLIDLKPEIPALGSVLSDDMQLTVLQKMAIMKNAVVCCSLTSTLLASFSNYCYLVEYYGSSR